MNWKKYEILVQHVSIGKHIVHYGWMPDATPIDRRNSIVTQNSVRADEM